MDKIYVRAPASSFLPASFSALHPGRRSAPAQRGKGGLLLPVWEIWSRTPLPGISLTHLCGERCKEANVGGNLVRTSEVRIDQQMLKIDLIPFRIVHQPDRMPTRRVLAKTAQAGEASSMQGNRRLIFMDY